MRTQSTSYRVARCARFLGAAALVGIVGTPSHSGAATGVTGAVDPADILQWPDCPPGLQYAFSQSPAHFQTSSDAGPSGGACSLDVVSGGVMGVGAGSSGGTYFLTPREVDGATYTFSFDFQFVSGTDGWAFANESGSGDVNGLFYVISYPGDNCWHHYSFTTTIDVAKPYLYFYQFVAGPQEMRIDNLTLDQVPAGTPSGLVGSPALKCDPPPCPQPTAAQCVDSAFWDAGTATCSATQQAQCATIVGGEIAQAESADGGVMYNVDTRTYPQNLSSTTPANLNQKLGALQPWNVNGVAAATDDSLPTMAPPRRRGKFGNAPPGLVLETNTELTYMSLMLGDYNAAYRDCNGTCGPRNLSPLVNLGPANFTPHTWVKHLAGQAAFAYPYYSFSDTAGSCQEYVWKLWHNFSVAEDRAASCGGDAACSYSALFDPSKPSPGSTALAVEPSFDRPYPAPPPGAFIGPGGGPPYYQIPAQSLQRPRNAFLGASASFLVDQDAGLNRALKSFNPNACIGTTSGPQPYGTTPFVPDGATLTPDMQAKLAQINAWLAPHYTYSYGNAPSGPNDIHFVDEWDFHQRMGAVTGVLPIPNSTVTPLPREVRLATRQRVVHFKSLLDNYDALTKFACTIAVKPVTKLSKRSLPTNVTATSALGTSGPGVSTQGPGAILRQQAVRAARQVQDQIVQALMEEYDRGDQGCLSRFNAPGRGRVDCDWFPEDAAPRAMGAFTAEREKDFRTCVQWTGNDFSKLQSPDPSVPGKIDDPSVQGVTDYIGTRQRNAVAFLNAAPAVDAAVDPNNTTGQTTGRTAVGQVIAGSKYYGDSQYFGGGYSYGAYWKVAPVEFYPNKDASGAQDPSGQVCELDGSIHGEFGAKVDVFKDRGNDLCAACTGSFASGIDPDPNAGTFVNLCPGVSALCQARYQLEHLAQASLDIQSNHTNKDPTNKATNNTFNADFIFVGEQVWNPGTVNFSLPYHKAITADPIEIPGLDLTVIILVIPVTIEAYAEVHYGADYTAGLYNTRTCETPKDIAKTSINVSTTFTPWAYADAFASVGVGFSFAQVGVRGHVRVVDGKLPLSASIGINADEDLTASSSALLDINLLAGDMSLFAQIGEPPFADIAQMQLFSWAGYHDLITIWDVNMTPIALPVLTAANWQKYEQNQLQ